MTRALGRDLPPRRLLAAALALAVFGCGDEDRGVGPEEDAGVDAARDGGRDAEPADGEVPPDGASPQDSGADATAGDAGPMDAAADAATDAADAAPDAGCTMADAGACARFTSSGCCGDTWCVPSDDLSSGQCTAVGAGARDDPCTDNEDCAEGLICVEEPDGGTCQIACDPDAATGGPGDTCSADDDCAALLGTDAMDRPVLLDLGICAPSCDYDAGLACRDSSLTCVPEELISADFDLCMEDVTSLSEMADCTAADLARLQLCGAKSLCYSRADLPDGTLCYEVCRGSEGSLDTVGHPDCSRTDALCETFATGLGLCR